MSDKKNELLDIEWQAYMNLSYVANCQGRFEESLKFAEKACFLQPVCDSLTAAAIALANMRRFADAVEIYEQASRLNPEKLMLKYNMGYSLLALKQLKEGYDLYDLRFTVESDSNFATNNSVAPAFIKRFPKIWDGKSVFRNLYLFGEQGNGDLIQFMRYLPFLIEDAEKMGGKITVEVPRSLMNVFKEKHPTLKFAARDADSWPLFRADIYDAAFSICSLAKLYLDREPEMPYLPSNPTKNEKMKIGLCWAGQHYFSYDNVRSIKLSEFKRLPLEDIDYYSFQMGPMIRKWPHDEEVNLFDYAFPFVANYGNEVVDFRDTMRFIDEMDLIISVDTSIVHLAGAMGKKVWLINKSLSDWRWCPDITEDNIGYSYLYPSVRIFTQKKYREWGEVMDQIATELKEHTTEIFENKKYLKKKERFYTETVKAKSHRIKDNWFETYAPEKLGGIDIGCGMDPLNQTFRRYDLIYGDGDATFMEGIPDESYYTVYASHVLEHLIDPVTALRNWWRILKPGGHLIIMVPHRDLYEKKLDLPSNWNRDHKTFWLPNLNVNSYTLGLHETFLKSIPEAEMVSLKILNEGYQRISDTEHSLGEFSIELIAKKPL